MTTDPTPPSPPELEPGDSGEVYTEEVEAEVVLEKDLLPEEVTAEALGLELPDDSDAARRLLLTEIADTRRTAGDHLDMLQRIAAEYDNYRKRTARDQGEMVERASQRVVNALLPALDDFDAALAYETQTPTEEKILEGMRGTHQKLMEILAGEGLEPIEALHEPFDPAVHEAIQAPAESEGHLVVSQQLRRGYKLKGRVLRPALVILDHA